MGQPWSVPQHAWDLMQLTTWKVSFQQFASCQGCCHLSQHHEKLVQLSWRQTLHTLRQLTCRWPSRWARWLSELWFGSAVTTCRVFICNLIDHFQRSFCCTAFAYCRQIKGIQSSKDIYSPSRMQWKCSTRKQHQEIYRFLLQNMLTDPFSACSLDKTFFPINSFIPEGTTPFCSRPWQAVYHQY